MFNGQTAPTINKDMEMRQLTAKGWILESGEISTKGKRIIKEIDGYFKRAKKKTDKIVMGDNFEDNITIYNELFPKKKLNTGKFARSSKNNLTPAFRWFFDNNDYTWEEVFKATATYLDDREADGWNYTINSQYFIRKQEVDKSWKSELSNWCQSVRDGTDKPEEGHFKENVF
jgi:hypothetical protein